MMENTRINDIQTHLQELGLRLMKSRQAKGLTQATLSEKAGVSKRTVERMEKGYSIQTLTLVKVLRVLGLIQQFDGFISLEKESPLDATVELKPEENQDELESTSKSRSWGALQ